METNVETQAANIPQNVQPTTDSETVCGKTTAAIPNSAPIISFDCPFPTLDQIESPVTVSSQNNNDKVVSVSSDHVKTPSTVSQDFTVQPVTAASSSLPYSGHVKLPAINEIFGRKSTITTYANSATVASKQNVPSVAKKCEKNSACSTPLEMQPATNITNLLNAPLSSPLHGKSAQVCSVFNNASEPFNTAIQSVSIHQTSTASSPSYTKNVLKTSEITSTILQSVGIQKKSTVCPSYTHSVTNSPLSDTTSSGLQPIPIQQTPTTGTINSSQTNTAQNTMGPTNAARQSNLYNYESSSSVGDNIWNCNDNRNQETAAQQLPTLMSSSPQTYIVAGAVEAVQGTQYPGMSSTDPSGNSSTCTMVNTVTASQRNSSGRSTQVNIHQLSRFISDDATPSNVKTKTADVQVSVNQLKQSACKLNFKNQPTPTIPYVAVRDHSLRPSNPPQPTSSTPFQPMVFVPSKSGHDGTFEIMTSALDLSGITVDTFVDGTSSGEMPQGLIGFIEEFSKSPFPTRSVQDHLKRLQVGTTPSPMKKERPLEIDMRPVKQGRDETMELARKKITKKAKSKTKQTYEDTNYSLPADSSCTCQPDVYCEEVPYEQVFIRNGQMYRLPDANVLRMANFEIYGFLKQGEWYVSLALFFMAVGFDVRKLYEVAMMYSNSLAILILGDNEMELLAQKCALSHQTNFKELISTSCIKELSKAIFESNQNTPVVSQLATGEYDKKILGSMTKCSNCGLWVSRKEIQNDFELLVKPTEIETSYPALLPEETVKVNIGNLAVNNVNFVVFEMDTLLYISLKEVIWNKIFTLATIQQRLQKIEFMPIRAPREVDEQFDICGTPVRNTLWIDLWSLSSICCMGRVYFNGRRDDIAHAISSRKWQFQQTFSLVAEDTRKSKAHFTIDPATLEILEKSEPFHVAEPEMKTSGNGQKPKLENSDVCVSSTTEDHVLLEITDAGTVVEQDAARCVPISGNIAFGTPVTCNTIVSNQSSWIQAVSNCSTNLDSPSIGYKIGKAFSVDEVSTHGRPRKRKHEPVPVSKSNFNSTSKRAKINDTKNRQKAETGLIDVDNLSSLKLETKQRENNGTPLKHRHQVIDHKLPAGATGTSHIPEQPNHDNSLQPSEYRISNRKISEITLSYGEYIVPDLESFMKQMEKGELRFTRKSMSEKLDGSNENISLSMTLPSANVSQLLQTGEVSHADCENNERKSGNSVNSNINSTKDSETSPLPNVLTGESSPTACDVIVSKTDDLTDNPKHIVHTSRVCISKSSTVKDTGILKSSNGSPRMKLNYSVDKSPTKSGPKTNTTNHELNTDDGHIAARTVDDLLENYETRMAVNSILEYNSENVNYMDQSDDSMNASANVITCTMSQQDDGIEKENLEASDESKTILSPEKIVDKGETVNCNSEKETVTGDVVNEIAISFDVPIVNMGAKEITYPSSNKCGIGRMENDGVTSSSYEDKDTYLINSVPVTSPDTSDKCTLGVGKYPKKVQQPNPDVKGVTHQEITSPTKQQRNSLKESHMQRTASSPGLVKCDTIHPPSSKRVERIRKEFESQYSPDISLQILAATATAVDEDSEASDVESEKDVPRPGLETASEEIQRRLSIPAPEPVPNIPDLIRHVIFSKEIRDGRVIFLVANFRPSMQKLFPALFKLPDIERKQTKFKRVLSEYMTEKFYKFQRDKHAKALTEQHSKSGTSTSVQKSTNGTSSTEILPNKTTEQLKTGYEEKTLQSHSSAIVMIPVANVVSDLVNCDVISTAANTNTVSEADTNNVSEADTNSVSESVNPDMVLETLDMGNSSKSVSTTKSSELEHIKVPSKSLANELKLVTTNKTTESVDTNQVLEPGNMKNACKIVDSTKESESENAGKTSNLRENTMEAEQTNIESECLERNNRLKLVQTEKASESMETNETVEAVDSNKDIVGVSETVESCLPKVALSEFVSTSDVTLQQEQIQVAATVIKQSAVPDSNNDILMSTSQEKSDPKQPLTIKDCESEHETSDNNRTSNKDLTAGISVKDFENEDKGLRICLRTRRSKMSKNIDTNVEIPVSNKTFSGKLSCVSTVSSESDLSKTQSLRKSRNSGHTTNTDIQTKKCRIQAEESDDKPNSELTVDRQIDQSDNQISQSDSHTSVLQKRNPGRPHKKSSVSMNKSDRLSNKTCESEGDTIDSLCSVTDSKVLKSSESGTEKNINCTKSQSSKSGKSNGNDEKQSNVEYVVPDMQNIRSDIENGSSSECIQTAMTRNKANENTSDDKLNKVKEIIKVHVPRKSSRSVMYSVTELICTAKDKIENPGDKTDDKSTSNDCVNNSESGKTCAKLINRNNNGSDLHVCTNIFEAMSTRMHTPSTCTPDGELKDNHGKDTCIKSQKDLSQSVDNTAESVKSTESYSLVVSVTSCSQLPENQADPWKTPIVKLSNFLPKVLPQELLEKSPHLCRRQVIFHCTRRGESPVKNIFMEGLQLNNTVSPQPSTTHRKRNKRGTVLDFSSVRSEAFVIQGNTTSSQVERRKIKGTESEHMSKRTRVKHNIENIKVDMCL